VHDPPDDVAALQQEVEILRGELDQISTAVSHDLRAALRGITNLASWIDEDLPEVTDPTIRDHLRLLCVRTQHMDRLLGGIVELARIGRARVAAERVELTELVHEAIVQCNPPDASRVMMIGELPMLVTDRAALLQIFGHLVANALQHAGRPDVVVRISAVDRGDAWELVVADNGGGIASEHRGRVWELFQTVRAPAADGEPAGIGIGLPIVKTQVARHGGRVWIDDSVPGTTIRFTWPKQQRI